MRREKKEKTRREPTKKQQLIHPPKAESPSRHKPAGRPLDPLQTAPVRVRGLDLAPRPIAVDHADAAGATAAPHRSPLRSPDRRYPQEGWRRSEIVTHFTNYADLLFRTDGGPGGEKKWMTINSFRVPVTEMVKYRPSDGSLPTARGQGEAVANIQRAPHRVP